MKTRNKKRSSTIRVGDRVQVIAGKDKGLVGEVLKLDWAKERIVVKGANIVTRHVKPSQKNQEGRIDRFEAPIHYSNVLLYCPTAKQGTRVRIQRDEHQNKQRVAVKSSNIIE